MSHLRQAIRFAKRRLTFLELRSRRRHARRVVYHRRVCACLYKTHSTLMANSVCITTLTHAGCRWRALQSTNGADCSVSVLSTRTVALLLFCSCARVLHTKDSSILKRAVQAAGADGVAKWCCSATVVHSRKTHPGISLHNE